MLPIAGTGLKKSGIFGTPARAETRFVVAQWPGRECMWLWCLLGQTETSEADAMTAEEASLGESEAQGTLAIMDTFRDGGQRCWRIRPSPPASLHMRMYSLHDVQKS